MLLVYYFLGCVISIIAVSLSVWYCNYLKFERHLKHIPGPTPFPLVGSALSFSSTNKILPAFARFHKKYGSVFRVYIGMEPNIAVCDHEAVEFLLSSSTMLDKASNYKYLHSWLGTGLLTSTGEKWRKRRKTITPSFHFQILEQFVETFNSASDIMIRKLKKEVGKSSTDVYPYVTLCALDIICETAMGTSVNAQERSDSEYVRSVGLVTKIMVERTFSSIQQFDLLYYFTENYRLERKALNVLHKYTDDVIKSRKLLIGNDSDADTNDIGAKKRIAFLDLLLRSTIDGQPLPDDAVREEVDTFMFEGHDTTSSAISFTLYCLSNHHDIQREAFNEIRDIFSDDWNRQATYQDLQNMKYLELVIKETLRLYPSVPMIGRKMITDVNYRGRVIPKGASVFINMIDLHRDPKIFPDPEKFDPQRFSSENVRKSPFAYVPFSAGPRNCIGQKFAMLEIKASVSKILRNFELLPVVPMHKPELLFESILKSANGIRLRLKTREL